MRDRESQTNLSPKPWAMITVAVCFFSAGTMKGARDILIRYLALPFEVYKKRKAISWNEDWRLSE